MTTAIESPTAFTISFRAKVESVKFTDGTLASRFIRVPALERRHVADMAQARNSRRFGGYANSDLFPGMIRRAALAAGCRESGGRMIVDLLKPVPGIDVDESGFLAVVTINVPDTE